MKIVVDAMGGDFAPKVNVDGAIDALREYSDMEIILVGPQALVEDTIAAYAQPEEMAKVRSRDGGRCAGGHHDGGASRSWHCAERRIRRLLSAWISSAARKRKRSFPQALPVR